jgi:hypothetical protein
VPVEEDSTWRTEIGPRFAGQNDYDQDNHQDSCKGDEGYRRIELITATCDRLVLDSSRDDRHVALLEAGMTADALIVLERLLKQGVSGAARSWTST